MEFDRLVNDGVITKATRDWMEPLWHQEEDEAQTAREATSQNLFINDTVCCDRTEADVDDLVQETTSLTILGTAITYQRDDNSFGHGNRVWAAAIASCFYLKDFLQTRNEKEAIDGACNARASFRSIELGAGTAVPSLYLAHLLADQEHSSAVVHVTDAKQYRNLRQIVASVVQQPETVQQRTHFRVSPHDWGTGIGPSDEDCSFLNDECYLFGSDASKRHTYDLVVVSDCIYNVHFHSKLLHSISTLLALPSGQGVRNNDGINEGRHSDGSKEGGCAIISFSLHGNTSDKDVWRFFEMAESTYSADGKWKLQSVPVSSLSSLNKHADPSSGRCGWHMEAIMKDLGVWVAHLEPRRWVAYLYELRWVAVGNEES